MESERRSTEPKMGVRIPLGRQNTLRDGLEVVPAGSHKPNDGGSTPPPATKGSSSSGQKDEVYRFTINGTKIQ